MCFSRRRPRGDALWEGCLHQHQIHQESRLMTSYEIRSVSLTWTGGRQSIGKHSLIVKARVSSLSRSDCVPGVATLARVSGARMDANVKTFGAGLRPSPAVGAAERVFSRVVTIRPSLRQRRNAGHCTVFARTTQVPFPEANPPSNSLLAKLSKAAILLPAIGVALFSCNNANARAAPPVEPKISTSHSVPSTSSPTSTLFASASAAMGNPKVRVTALAICLAVAATAAARHSQKRKSMKAKAAEKSDDTSDSTPDDPQSSQPSKPQKGTVPDPGVIFLGLAGLMIDAVSDSPRKPTSSRISASIVEAEPAGKEKEKESNVVALDAAKDIGISNAEKYDLFVELVNAGNNLVADVKYDPIRAMLAEASRNVTSFTRSFFSSIEWQGDDRYDLVSDLFTRMKSEGIAVDPKYDPLYRALKVEVPSGSKKFDPLGGIVKVARAPVNFVANKFDLLRGVFKGKWQSENQSLENLPKWDPVSAVHASAGQPLDLEDSKYDPAVTAQRREWLTENSTIRSPPKWDPISGVQEAARSPMAFKLNRYDVTEAILRGEWLKTLASLSDLPSWDPTSKIVEIATDTKESTSPAKYDAIPSLLHGEWRGALGDESWEEESKSAAQTMEMEPIDATEQMEEIKQIDGKKEFEQMEPIDATGQSDEIVGNKQLEEIVGSTQLEEIVGSTQLEEIVGDTQLEEIVGDTQLEEIVRDTQLEEIVEKEQLEEIAEEEGKETQAEVDAEEALMRRLEEEEAQEAAKLEAEIAKIASESVAEKIVSAKMDPESDKAKMQKQTRAFESKTQVLRSIAALIREFESVQQMDALKT